MATPTPINEAAAQAQSEAAIEKALSATERKLMRRTEANLTPKMKARRDAFILEYLVDFNGPLAVLRSGGAQTTAAKMSSEFLREPYVAKKVQECIDALEEAQLISRKRVLAGLVREANYQGIGASHGARVAAWNSLAKILGMEAPAKVNVAVSGGVMVVPVAGNLNEWELAAEEAQKQLKEAVRQ